MLTHQENVEEPKTSYVEALEAELRGYDMRGQSDRAAEVRAELARVTGRAAAEPKREAAASKKSGKSKAVKPPASTATQPAGETAVSAAEETTSE